jgi:T4-like virus tail tube protein gp19
MGNIPRIVAGNYFLTLDGAPCGFLRSAEGGDQVGEVVSVAVGPGEFVRKQLGRIGYEDLELRLGLSMPKDLYDWIDASWQLQPTRRNGSVIEVGADGKPRAERAFSNALISETGFPALDAASKEAAFLTVRLTPEQVVLGKPSEAKLPAQPKPQKQFLPANFRFELGTLDCSRVSKIDAFTVKQTMSAVDVGETRIVEKEPTVIEFPNLRVTFAAADAPSWQSWFDEFVVKGSNDDQHELAGAIVFLAPDRKQELARIELRQVGIFALRRPPAAATDRVARFVAELYCERMSLRVAGG